MLLKGILLLSASILSAYGMDEDTSFNKSPIPLQQGPGEQQPIVSKKRKYNSQNTRSKKNTTMEVKRKREEDKISMLSNFANLENQQQEFLKTLTIINQQKEYNKTKEWGGGVPNFIQDYSTSGNIINITDSYSNNTISDNSWSYVYPPSTVDGKFTEIPRSVNNNQGSENITNNHHNIPVYSSSPYNSIFNQMKLSPPVVFQKVKYLDPNRNLVLDVFFDSIPNVSLTKQNAWVAIKLAQLLICFCKNGGVDITDLKKLSPSTCETKLIGKNIRTNEFHNSEDKWGFVTNIRDRIYAAVAPNNISKKNKCSEEHFLKQCKDFFEVFESALSSTNSQLKTNYTLKDLGLPESFDKMRENTQQN